MNMFARRLALIVLLSCGLGAAHADNTPQTLPFAQNWSDTGLIAANDSWSGVPGIEGFRGDGLVAGTAADPQAILAADSPGVIDVNANQTAPNTFTAGGVSEFDLADDVVALAGSGTARAPYLKLHLNTTGASNVTVAYNLRDVDGSADNAAQPVALQYRVGNSGDFINVPAAFVADASSGPSLATLVTAVSATLPAAADNQPLVEVRIITADAAGSDEWIGIDDIAVSAGVVGDDPVLSVTDTSAAEGDIVTSPFFFSVNLSQPAGPGGVSFDYATVDGTAQAGTDYIAQTASATIPEGVTSIIFGVDVNGDTDTEANETFVVRSQQRHRRARRRRPGRRHDQQRRRRHHADPRHPGRRRDVAAGGSGRHHRRHRHRPQEQRFLPADRRWRRRRQRRHLAGRVRIHQLGAAGERRGRQPRAGVRFGRRVPPASGPRPASADRARRDGVREPADDRQCAAGRRSC